MICLPKIGYGQPQVIRSRAPEPNWIDFIEPVQARLVDPETESSSYQAIRRGRDVLEHNALIEQTNICPGETLFSKFYLT